MGKPEAEKKVVFVKQRFVMARSRLQVENITQKLAEILLGNLSAARHRWMDIGIEIKGSQFLHFC